MGRRLDFFRQGVKAIRGGSRTTTRSRSRSNTRQATFRARRAGTRTMVHRKKKFHSRGVGVGAGGFESHFTGGKNRLDKTLSQLVKQNDLTPVIACANGATRLSAQVGTQAATAAFSVAYNNTDLNTIFQSMAMTGTSYPLTGSQAKTAEYILESMKGGIDIINVQNSVVEITLYDIVNRRDLNSQTGWQDPVTAWNSGWADEGGTVGFNGTTFVGSATVGSTPFVSEIFNLYYKVVKVTHQLLAPGQAHSHRVKYNAMQKFNAELQLGSSNYGYKGLTRYVMVVIRGMPSNDSTTKTTVSTGSATVDIVSYRQYKTTALLNAQHNVRFIQTIPYSYAVGEEIPEQPTGAPSAPSVS